MGGEARPTFTVVTATLDRAATIGATLASVAAQTRQDLEHVVVDGGSTDGTIERVLAARHRVRLVSGRDHGIYDAFNRGLALARGEWVAFLNADDAWAHPRVVEEALAAAAPGVDVVHGDLDVVDAAGVVVRTLRFVPGPPPDPYASMATGLAVFHPATFARRELLLDLGGFDARLRIAGDYDLFARAWRGGARFAHVPSVWTRMGAGGVSEARPWRRGLEVYAVSRRVTGARAAPALELARFQLMRLLDERARGVADLLRRAKRLARPTRTGPLADWTGRA